PCTHPGKLEVPDAGLVNAGEMLTESNRVGSPISYIRYLCCRVHVVDAVERSPCSIGSVAWVNFAITTAAAYVVAAPQFMAVLWYIQDNIVPNRGYHRDVYACAIDDSLRDGGV